MDQLISITQVAANGLFVASPFIIAIWLIIHLPDLGTIELAYREPAGPRGVADDDLLPWDLSRLHRPPAAPQVAGAIPDGRAAVVSEPGR